MPVEIEEGMHGGIPVLVVSGIVVEHPNIDGERNNVAAVIETAVAPPRDDREAFERWALEEAAAAIRTRDDGQAQRPSIWPDGSEHTVYRVWHLNRYQGMEQVSIWSTRQGTAFP